jgi:hypothetical protein
MNKLTHLKRFNESEENLNISDVSNSLDGMTSSQIKRFIMNNFVATRTNIEKLVDATKDFTQREMMSISYSLGVTAGALYCLMMENKYGIKVSI